MATFAALPDFVRPMMADSGQPFDSDEHLFEIKWDGIRIMAFIEHGSYRLMTRRGFRVTERYPDLEFLDRLPVGTVLDGELVVLNEAGTPDFRSVMSREQARTAGRIQTLARSTPAHFIVFDQLYYDFEPVIQQPLSQRRARLLETVHRCDNKQLAVSDGVGERVLCERHTAGSGRCCRQAVDKSLLSGDTNRCLDQDP